MGTSSKRRGKQPWHAVSIIPRGNACEPVLALHERRFLSTEAPLLPLPDCPNPGGCRCIYRHFTERRAGPRRSFEESGIRGARPSAERRHGRGRRSSD